MTITTINLKDVSRKEALWISDELSDLLRIEFKTIKKPISLDFDKELFSKTKTKIAGIMESEYEDAEYICINMIECRKHKHFRKNIREILRHELLHIELNKRDDDPEFINEAIKRKIELNDKEYEKVMGCLFFEDISSLFFNEYSGKNKRGVSK